jgi:hypothetical protein
VVGWRINVQAGQTNVFAILLTTAAASMCKRKAVNRSLMCCLLTLVLFKHHTNAQWDVCGLFGDKALPFGTREFCTATGLADKGSSDNNGCMILGVMEEALQSMSSAPTVCSAARQVPAAAVSLDGERHSAAFSVPMEQRRSYQETKL